MLAMFGGLSPPFALAQEPAPADAREPGRAFWMEQNYPNPVTPETWIPFHLEQEIFADGRTGVVSIRIYNILRQVVAIPVLVDSAGKRKIPLSELRFSEPGRKVAYWDGRDTNGRRVPSGIYYAELVVDDDSDFIRLVVVTRKARSRFLPRL